MFTWLKNLYQKYFPPKKNLADAELDGDDDFLSDMNGIGINHNVAEMKKVTAEMQGHCENMSNIIDGLFDAVYQDMILVYAAWVEQVLELVEDERFNTEAGPEYQAAAMEEMRELLHNAPANPKHYNHEQRQAQQKQA